MIDLNRLGAETFAGCERRGMHDPLPSVVEVLMKTTAELGEEFDAWIFRHRD